MDYSPRLIIDAPALTIVESPASPIMDSPASPVMESPASPTPDTPKTTTQKRSYTPVVIPAVSTVTITRRDPRTAANRSSSSRGTSSPSNTTNNQSVSYSIRQETTSASPSAPTYLGPPTKPLPKSILMKPSSSADPRLYGTSSRTVISESPADGETSQFLAKHEIVWKGFLNMLSVAKFVTKGYMVSGTAENLKADLPDTIQIAGRILPQTVWDYVAKLKTSVTKASSRFSIPFGVLYNSLGYLSIYHELCVIRFHPATEEEEVAYVSLFSYFSSRGRYGVVANGSRSIKDVYLVPLSAKESIPTILQPLDGPGFEKNRPNLLLGLAVIQKTKRPGSLPQEIEEKRPKVNMSKDPMWIPKPPVLYGSDKLEIFQPYDPETPANTSPPGSPLCPGSPSDSSSTGSVALPSCYNSFRTNPPFSTSAAVAATQSTSESDKNATAASSNKSPLQTILKSLFGNKQTDSVVSSDVQSSTATVHVKKVPVFSKVSRSMVDPIVQQYGQKSKNIEKMKAEGPAVSGCVDDDVAYDPEDDTIFADMQREIAVTKPPAQTQTSGTPSCQTPVSTQIKTPTPNSTAVQSSTQAVIMQNIPTGTVVVSAATLTEQQRMLEDLNRQIEEQKQQLKEQEEALRQQREAVGIFMARFSVSDSLMSPPQKALPLSQLSESTDKTSNLTETEDSSNVDSQTVKQDTTATPNVEKDKTQADVKESDKYSSAGEIEDSDVAYDPEDESLFDEIQDDVFQGGSIKTLDLSLSRTGHSASRKGSPLSSHHSRKRRGGVIMKGAAMEVLLKDHSDVLLHIPGDIEKRIDTEKVKGTGQGIEPETSLTAKVANHSHGRRRSPCSPRKTDSGSLSPKWNRDPSPQVLEISKPLTVLCNAPDSLDSVDGTFLESNQSSSSSVTIKNYPPVGHQLKSNLVKSVDEGFSPSSHELLHNVKLNTLKDPKSQEPQNTSVSGDTDSGSSNQVNIPSQLETLFSKFEIPVPLRETDPPIRDSPQSPDPEPQFVKPISTEKRGPTIEEIRDPQTLTSVSMPHDKVESICLPIGGQATMSKILWPTGRGALVLEGQGVKDEVKDEVIKEADKQIERGHPGFKHPKILGQGEGDSIRAIGSDIQASELKKIL
ncbi:hypothetical protein F7725_000951 [Dissostichus mawsoni]|uniref:Spen paralogue and orthologue SPOC C-terminal domain-containing protein n=1 Tax=Dissostichus mawsoni TaxID=36200 RepID=A0A7J5ZGC9_DISMA|nr:hypothetical protein F7725_000951 [Dissostichus mawsoni]